MNNPLGQRQLMGRRIRAARLKRGLSAQAVADFIETSASILKRWEQGEKSPTEQNLDRLCEALGVSVTWLMRGDYNDADLLATLTPARAAGEFLTIAEHRAALDATRLAETNRQQEMEQRRIAANEARRQAAFRPRCQACKMINDELVLGICPRCWSS